MDAADAYCGDRLLERDIRDAEGGGGPVDGEDIGINLAVRGEQDADDLGVVEVVLWEKWAQGSVGHARGQDLLLAWTSLALEVTARELADSRGLFLVVNGQGEKILALLDGGGGDGADEHNGLA